MGLEEKRRKVDGTSAVFYALPDSDEPVFFKRIDFPDQVYGTENAKDKAIVSEIRRINETGQPVLVGTTSVEHSETIDSLLEREGVPHRVLNAKIHQSEALLVAQAGRRGAVTISTNMAGRGTDILLGGNPEALAAEELEEKLFTRHHVNQLALNYLKDGEEDAVKYARNHPKLRPDLVPRLVAIHEEYKEAHKEIERMRMEVFVARVLLEEYGVDRTLAQQVVRLVRNGLAVQARALLAEQNLDISMVEEAGRVVDLHTRYQAAAGDTQKEAEFLAEQLFEVHYNGRAALIRALMEGDRQGAERLVQEVPGLAKEHIEMIDNVRQQAVEERRLVWELGGLYVIGSERHESRRIDNQLRGRAARQGDPGASRFFLSLEDDLMLRFGGERLKNFMTRTNIPDDMPIENSVLDRLIESSQERLEGYNFDIRKNVVEYDDVMNVQRQSIYDRRRAILMSETDDLDERISAAFAGAISDVAENYLEDYPGYVHEEIQRAIHAFSTDATDTINVNGVLRRMRALLPGVVELEASELEDASAEELTAELMHLAHENVDQGLNLFQFLQATGRFIPIVPAIPNMGGILSGRRSGHIQIRERIKHDFLEQLDTLFNEFLAEHAVDIDRDLIYNRASGKIENAFSQYNVTGVSSQAIQDQQPRFLAAVSEALRELLVDTVAALDTDQLVSALKSYVASQQEKWEAMIGEEEYRNYQRLLLLSAIDREWRDYLVAMDDLRREVGLEAVAQRDPKVEYKRRSYEMFSHMRRNIDESIADRFFREIAGHQQFVRRQQEMAKAQLQLNQAAPSSATSSGGNRSSRRGAASSNGSGKKNKRARPARRSYRRRR
jgi:preprotein translocase subunit SecA